MELNYALQSKLKLIPLMMEEHYVPKGWLGLILGTRRAFLQKHCHNLCRVTLLCAATCSSRST